VVLAFLIQRSVVIYSKTPEGNKEASSCGQGSFSFEMNVRGVLREGSLDRQPEGVCLFEGKLKSPGLRRTSLRRTLALPG
jgi:hypothetical protein